MTHSGVEPATYRLVAQSVTNCICPVPVVLNKQLIDAELFLCGGQTCRHPQISDTGFWKYVPIHPFGRYQTFAAICCLCAQSKSEYVTNIFVDTGTLQRKYGRVKPEISLLHGSSTLELVINQSDRIKLVSATNRIV
jgi:hypothetical protein